MRNNYDWCYISGRVSILGSLLLKDDFFRRLLASETLEEDHRIISDSPLKEYFIQKDDLYKTESLLNRYYLDRLVDISRSSPDRSVCDLFRLRYNFLNLKNYIKEKILFLPYERHPLGEIPDELWRGLWDGEDLSSPEIFSSTVTLLKKNISNGGSTAIVIDSIMDNAYLTYLLEIAKGIRSSFIEDFIWRYKLVRGIEIIWRALSSGNDRELMPEFLFLTIGLSENDLFFRLTHSPMDKWRLIFPDIFPIELCKKIFTGLPSEWLKRFVREMDDYLFQGTQVGSYYTFGPELVFLYLIGFTREVFNLGLTIKGKLNMVTPSLIEERLRKIYV